MAEMTIKVEAKDDAASQKNAIAKLSAARERILAEVSKSVIGQNDVIEQIIVAFFARGHCLLMGVPGLGKTLLVKSLASCLHLQSNRIQFTPDLMPADIVGSMIIETDERGGKGLRFQPGPVFANLVLADEINRAPAKVQSALLEVMGERHVTIGGTRFDVALQGRTNLDRRRMVSMLRAITQNTQKANLRIVLGSPKGGCGKTAITTFVSSALAGVGAEVLLIELTDLFDGWNSRGAVN